MVVNNVNLRLRDKAGLARESMVALDAGKELPGGMKGNAKRKVAMKMNPKEIDRLFCRTRTRKGLDRVYLIDDRKS